MLAEQLRALPERVTGWVTMDAARVQAFADATEDWQFVHLDDARAARETAFGGAIAHGFLTLSMLSRLSYEATEGLEGVASSVNYGFDRVRFVSPVRVGARLRGRFAVAGVEAGDGWLCVRWDVTLEIAGVARPALVAHWITRLYCEDCAPAP